MLPPASRLKTSELHERCCRGAQVLVDACAGLRQDEKALILSNPETRDVAAYLEAECRRHTDAVRHETLKSSGMHGAAPAPQVGLWMIWADVVFCATKMSLAHTPERLEANRKGTRFLSLPDYSLDVLASTSLTFDFKSAIPEARRLEKHLNSAAAIRVQTAQGTDLAFCVQGRTANVCPGLCLEPGALGSPPDAEVNIAPLEETAQGILVVDGSIPCRELGLVDLPLTLEIEAGKIARVSGPGEQPRILEQVLGALGNPHTRWLAEFGIGLNTMANLSGSMLEDEGCAGTVHFGFGSNATIGGRIRVPFHLDFVIKAATVQADGLTILQTANPLGR